MKGARGAESSTILLLVAGVLFIAGGVFSVVAYAKGASDIMIWVAVGCFALAALCLTFGILRLVKVNKCKALIEDPNAYTTEAKFIKSVMVSYSTRSVGVGNIDVPTSINVYKKVVYEYADENGNYQKVKSVFKYFPKQVDFLKEKGTFKIKCKGKLSAIMEEMPDDNSRFNI